MGGSPIIVRIKDVLSLNEPSRERFTVTFQPGAKVLDAFDDDKPVPNPETIRQWQPPE